MTHTGYSIDGLTQKLSTFIMEGIMEGRFDTSHDISERVEELLRELCHEDVAGWGPGAPKELRDMDRGATRMTPEQVEEFNRRHYGERS